MKKKVVGFTIAGMLALPLVMGGGQANAAAQTKDEICKAAKTDLLNPWKLKDQQNTNLDELLKKLGITLDFAQIQEQLSKSPEAANTAEKPESPKKDRDTQAEKPEQAKPAEPQQADTPANSEKPAADNSEKPSDSQSSNSEMNAYEQKVVELTNQERTKAGLQPLKADNSTLSKMARAKSQDMSDKNYFDHQSPTYGSPFDMMKKFGISYKSAGENIAAGQKTPEEVVQGWMNSPGHRANILNASFTTIGVGYVQGGSYGSYWTQEFIGN
ncbi:CAP domain-containing protein [Sporolactobacillus shoreicorticis]|uniref:CAP domain-containing protein n=1 Tax=Sporolactobacillus shoreicorticis TaxID=1923877 RepID=A0ABW5S980_9BACL|nr:CAP domain-containing protein [Sporolactobacillus shoreicorticis]MCO7127297.1 CAP domain-containing protein [Sporolactobacillus shoreicorticis]